MTAANGGGDLAAYAKACVQATIRFAADQGDIVVGAIVHVAGKQDFAICLKGESQAIVIAGAHRNGDLASRSERGVESAARGAAHQGKICIGAVGGVATDHDLAISLHRNRVTNIVAAADGNGDFASRTKTGVKRTSRGVAHECNIVVRSIVGGPYNEDFSIGL